MDYSLAGWTIIVLIWLSIGVYVHWLIGPALKDKLMRCPETNAVTLVGVSHSARLGKGSRMEVERCGLWPEKEQCARGCLARYEETPNGLRIDSRGLDPS
jgi:hypothetical protein